MDLTTKANIAALVGAIFTLGGLTGITSADINGFFNVVFGIITIVGIIVAHFSHKASTTTLSAQ